MAIFINGLPFTDAGKALNAKLLTTGKPLVITGVGLGSGSALNTVTNELSDEVLRTNNMTTKIQAPDIAMFRINFNSEAAEIDHDWALREMGLYATDPDVGEILYCYGNAGDQYDTIPAGGGSQYVEYVIQVAVKVADAANIDLNVDIPNRAEAENIGLPQDGAGFYAYKDPYTEHLMFRRLEEGVINPKTNNISIKQAIANFLMPAGYPYTQEPGDPEPKTLWPMFNWDDITFAHAGLFTRYEDYQQDETGIIQAPTEIEEIVGNVDMETVDGNTETNIIDTNGEVNLKGTAGTINSVTIDGITATLTTAAPNSTQYNLNGNILTFNLDNIGKEVVVTYLGLISIKGNPDTINNVTIDGVVSTLVTAAPTSTQYNIIGNQLAFHIDNIGKEVVVTYRGLVTLRGNPDIINNVTVDGVAVTLLTTTTAPTDTQYQLIGNTMVFNVANIGKTVSVIYRGIFTMVHHYLDVATVTIDDVTATLVATTTTNPTVTQYNLNNNVLAFNIDNIGKTVVVKYHSNAVKFEDGVQNQGLPNITGRADSMAGWWGFAGALKAVAGEKDAMNPSGTGGQTDWLTIDASLSNPTYGRNGTQVNPVNESKRKWRRRGIITGQETVYLYNINNVLLTEMDLNKDEAGLIGYNPNCMTNIPPTRSKDLAANTQLVFNRETGEWAVVPIPTQS